VSAAPEGWRPGIVLGRGAITTTFLVERGEEHAVCKRLLPRALRDAEARASLVREGKIVRHLGGRGAPRWLAEGDDDAGPWLLVEHVAMSSLGALMRKTAGPLAPAFVAAATEAAFDALERVHEAEVVHADLSPDNVLVRADGRAAVLIDFGLASAPGEPHVTGGAFRGTLAYAAPEVARGEPFGAAADRFALAASLAHAALGAPPRDGPEAAMLVRAGAEALDAYAARARAVVGGAAGDRIARHLAFDARVR
jgi:serine/threonine protein kinase